MKKYLLFAATAAMMLASCSSEVDFTQQDLQQAKAENAATPVQFGTYLGNSATTRATGGQTGGMTTKTLQESTAGFGVIAYVKGDNGVKDCYTSPSTWEASTPNFMYNEKVTYSTDHWTYSPVKFWPNDFAQTNNVDNKEPTGETTEAIGSANAGKVSFFAYAPYVAPANYTTKSNDHKLNSTDDTAFDISGAVTDGIVAITANDYTGEPQVKYVLGSADLANSVDLLWGIRKKGTTYNKADNTTDTQASSDDMYNTDLTKQKVGETVKFFFKHALAKIGGNFYEEHGSDPATKNSGLQIVLDLDNGSQNGGVTTTGAAITGGVKEDATLVTVSDIQIEDLATYSTRTSVNTYGTTSNLIKSGWFNIATGTWSEPTTGATYNHNVTNSSAVTGSGAVGYALNAAIKEGTTVTYDSGWKIDGAAQTGVTTTAQNVYTDNSNAPALLLIPGSTDQTIVVTITYTVRTYDPKLATLSGETTNTKVTQTITNAVTIPASSLASNKYYKLLIHLGLTSVKFSATVSDWSIPGDTNGNGSIDGSETEEKEEIWLPSNTL